MCFCSLSAVSLQREDTLVLFSAMLYECVTQECPEMLPTYVAIEQVKGEPGTELMSPLDLYLMLLT